MQGNKLEILEANYWEHYKHSKDLAQIFPLDHPKRLKMETALLQIMNKIKEIRNTILLNQNL